MPADAEGGKAVSAAQAQRLRALLTFRRGFATLEPGYVENYRCFAPTFDAPRIWTYTLAQSIRIHNPVFPAFLP